MKKFIFIIFMLLIPLNCYAVTYINNGDINWSGNWQVGAQVKTLHASTNLNVDSTTTQYSATWSGDGSTVHIGCLVYLNSITTPTTARVLTVTIQENIATVWTNQTSTNLTTSSATKTASWYYFKYSGTETETNAASNYRIMVTSNNAADTGFRADSASATNVAIIAVTQATGTLVAADVTYIVGTTQASTGNPTAQNVTVDINDAANGWGNIFVSNGGTVLWPSTASTNTTILVNGYIQMYNGSAWNMGTVASPIPLTSKANLQFNPASETTTHGFLKNIGSSLILQGATHSIFKTTLSADIAYGTITNFTTVDSTGWSVNDELLVCYSIGDLANSTDEIVNITGISGTTIYVDTNGNGTGTGISMGNHHGHAEPQAIVARMTRPIIINSTTAFGWYIRFESGAGNNDADFDGCQFKTVGGSGSFYGGFSPSSNVGQIAFDMDDSVIQIYKTTFISLPTWIGSINWEKAIFFNDASEVSTMLFSNSPQSFSLTNCLLDNLRQTNNKGHIFALSGTDRAIFSDVDFITCTDGDSNFRAISGAARYYLDDVTISNCQEIGNAWWVAVEEAPIVHDSNSWYGRYGGGNITDEGIIRAYNGEYIGYNITFASTVVNETVVINTFELTPRIHLSNYDGTTYRYYNKALYGNMTDNTTTVMTGQAGTCLVMNPSSSTAGNTLNWEFHIPVTAATDPNINFYVIQSAGTPSLNIDVYDSDDDNTLLIDNASITLTGSWAQYALASISPTDTGYVRVVLKALDDGSTRNIGIDTLTYDLDGTTYTVDFERWRDALPEMAGEGAGGGTSEHSYGYIN